MMVRRTNRSKYTIKEEVSRKPQAVRQVASELLDELGEPFDELWALLKDTHGGWEAGRIFAHVLGAVVEHGQQKVGEALRPSRTGQCVRRRASVSLPLRPRILRFYFRVDP